MAPVLFCLLLLLLQVSNISTTSSTPDVAVALAALKDLPSFVYHQYGRNFSDRWKKCIEDGPHKCPLYGSVSSQGPCQNGEIFVYNRRLLRTNGSIEPVCQPPPCPDGYILVIPHKKCYRNNDVSLGICSLALLPIDNLFGEFFCGCEFFDATLLGSKTKECHKLYTQGPCANGSLFVPVNDLVNFGQGQCLPSPCAKLANETEIVAEIRLPEGRTKCFVYPRETPCEGFLLVAEYSKTVFPGLKHLQCLKAVIRPSIQIVSSEKCVVNDEGLCVYRLKNKPVDPHPLYLEES